MKGSTHAALEARVAKCNALDDRGRDAVLYGALEDMTPAQHSALLYHLCGYLPYKVDEQLAKLPPRIRAALPGPPWSTEGGEQLAGLIADVPGVDPFGNDIEPVTGPATEIVEPDPRPWDHYPDGAPKPVGRHRASGIVDVSPRPWRRRSRKRRGADA